MCTRKQNIETIPEEGGRKKEKKKKKKTRMTSWWCWRKKRRKNASRIIVVTSPRSLFASYLLTGRELFARVIKVFWWHVTTIPQSKENSAINNSSFSSICRSNYSNSNSFSHLVLIITIFDRSKNPHLPKLDGKRWRVSRPILVAHDVLPCSSPTLLRIWLTHFHSHEALES